MIGQAGCEPSAIVAWHGAGAPARDGAALMSRTWPGGHPPLPAAELPFRAWLAGRQASSELLVP